MVTDELSDLIMSLINNSTKSTLLVYTIRNILPDRQAATITPPVHQVSPYTVLYILLCIVCYFTH